MRKAKKNEIFYKEEPDNKIWRVDNCEQIGPMEFSFDKKTIFNYWPDFPEKLTKEQLDLFCAEDPYWADFRRGQVEAMYSKFSRDGSGVK